MKKTKYLELPQFEGSDPIRAEDVNKAFEQLDSFPKTVSAPTVIELQNCAARAEKSAAQAGSSASAASVSQVEAAASAKAAADDAADVRAKAQQAAQDAAKAEAEANRAQAEADRATIPPVAGVYSIILQDRVTGTKYALIMEDGVLTLMETSNNMTPTDAQIVDNKTGIPYALAVENGILEMEEL